MEKACRSGPLADDADLVGTAGPTGSAATSRQWTGLALSATGVYAVCWCSARNNCDESSEYNVPPRSEAPRRTL